MAEEKYNLKNSAVKRILQEVKEMQSNPSDDFMSLPLEENIFEWQFAISGPRDTEFEGGIYHGRIQLPAEYPFKPPAFMLLTPNGRFETQTKICLSISNHHPEHWQPSWSVRTALVALIAFMPTNPDGALGSLDYTKEERHALAIKSREAAPKFGTPERQKLMDEIHQYMLSKAPPVPQLTPLHPSDDNSTSRDGGAQASPQNAIAVAAIEEHPNLVPEPRIVENVGEVHMNANAGPLGVTGQVTDVGPSEQQRRVQVRDSKTIEDRLFTSAAIGLTLAIVFLLVKKYMKANGYAI
ncbi:ubiquitin-conjugating enzyme E2 32 [Cinnamomum micranthum f. kanehirae]|uniref:Ubiquitin-conjugating enzyme E2 32 n=1 Tax=Cinnamomum micranthum f. kanehirae TaxID=337451 RepID=A0A443ND60_9MAGN|nr:ubiquitin-conjugating enzyme E2 32 [Cinnamomum micranthum f. kanehirae]